ncbi:FAD-binding oxidoreductase [Halobacterium yunchengense]|uniref:FAD-binding oxidoreductase n=1 Tax=Halobacterium yunchengense TaxID=3108497 RepID=UPI003009A71E
MTDEDGTQFVEEVASTARGTVLEPGDRGYDEARRVWNARVDREPAAVLQCTSTADVVAGVNAAREHGVRVSAKSGGHHVSGSAICEGGLLLDLAAMDDVTVDAGTRTATVGPGATWGDVDRETQAFGLAVPGGQDPNIGVAGLTLGGGVGWLSRKHGLTCDNLLAAEVVTADGDVVGASERRHEDLFWALRGGGGGFGVVTGFEFRLHEVATVFAGSLIYPLSAAPELARRYASFTDGMPREARLLFGLMELPAAPYYPESVHETRVAMLIACYAGSTATARRVFEPLRSFGDPVADSLRERSYVAWQGAGESRGRMRTHLRSQYLASLPDDAVEVVVDRGRAAPSAGGTVFVSPRGGAETEPSRDETAYPHRDADHHVLVEARWTDPGADDEHVDWVDEFHAAVRPYATGAAPLNFLADDEDAPRVRAGYGGNYDRLRAVKADWDPDGLFAGNPVFDAVE